MPYVCLLSLTCAIAVSMPAFAAESRLAQYRGVTLGDSVQVVVERLHLTAADVHVVHDSPSLIQQVSWRPRPFMSGSVDEANSVAEMQLTFQADRLGQIVVIYDRARTQGLTDEDVRVALGGTYGPSMLIPTSAQPRAAGSERVTIGRWEDATTLMILWREQFPNRIGLTITSIGSDAALQQAIADAARLAADGAPARELARRTAEAEAIRLRDEKIRLENKKTFKP
jgi:hypothetical protein